MPRRFPTLTELPEVSLIGQLRVHPHRVYARRDARVVRIVIHHSTGKATAVTPAGIARYHVGHLGWPGIGYHDCVGWDGVICHCNPYDRVSYHVASYNPTSVGVCLIGDFTKYPPSDRQLTAAGYLVAGLLEQFELGISAVVGHRELMATACPGSTWPQWKPGLLEIIQHVME